MNQPNAVGALVAWAVIGVVLASFPLAIVAIVREIRMIPKHHTGKRRYCFINWLHATPGTESRLYHGNGRQDRPPQVPDATPEVERTHSEDASIKREIPYDFWGVMQRIYGIRHSLLWPGQFAMIDMFKFVTVWCLILSLVGVIVRLLR